MLNRSVLSKKVTIVEVGLRDGLQNEKVFLNLKHRLKMAAWLANSGLARLEIGSFVSPKWVPQMKESSALINQIYSLRNQGQVFKKTQFSALVPNLEGMGKALQTPLKEVAIFTACSESFAKKNINCSIDQSFERFFPVIELAKKNKIKIRGYLSCCFGCPIEGSVSEKKVLKLANRLYQMGVYEISIGDTIGVANPAQVQSLFSKLRKLMPMKMLAGHFHDTRGTALANILMAYQQGVSVFDTSLGGLGGCPYAPGASGNVATEDVVYMLEGMGVKTGIRLSELVKINRWLSQKFGRPLHSKYAEAELGRGHLRKT